jgi:hypothetical protein
MAAKGAAKGSLNAKNLEALGAARLAELLIVVCEGNNASKRLLRLALAEHKGRAPPAPRRPQPSPIGS